MLRPDGAHLFISRKLGALGLRKGLVKRSLFLGGQRNRRFIVTGKLQEETRKGVLRFGGQGTDAFNSSFKQFGHVQRIRFSGLRRKQKAPAILPLNIAPCKPLFSWRRDEGAQILQTVRKLGVGLRKVVRTPVLRDFFHSAQL